MTIGLELVTLIAVREQGIELRSHTQTTPPGSDTEGCGIHGIVDGGSEDNVVGGTVTVGDGAVLLNGEDNLIRALVVVGQEEFLISVVVSGGSSMEAVSVIHNVLQNTGALIISLRSGEHLGIQVKLGQQEFGRCLVRMTVNGGILLGKSAVVHKVGEFFYQPVIKVRPLNLLGNGTHNGILQGEGHIAEVVNGMVIGDGTKHAGFVNHLLLGRERDVGSLSLTDELIGHSHLHEDAGIESVDKGITGGPGHPVEILDGLVIPAADTFVRGELAMVIQAADILRSTTVETGDGSTAILTIITGRGKAQIYAGEELFEGALVYQGLVGRIGVRVDRSHIEVTHARIDGQGGKDCCENICYLFHNALSSRIKN